MNKYLNHSIVAIFLCTAGCANSSKPPEIRLNDHGTQVKVADLPGRNIYEVKSLFEENGYYVAEIADITKTGEDLSTSVELVEKDAIDTFAYSAELDIAPWRKNRISHLLIKADINSQKIVQTRFR